MQKFTRSLIAFGGLVALAACGDDVSVTPPTPPPAPTVTGVTVSPAQATIKVGEKIILSANVAVNGSGVNTAVTWSSANAAIASVSATGEVTGVAAGQTTIRAASAANTGVAGSAAITVSADKGVQSVVVSPSSAILAPTQTLQATANVTTTSGVAKTVTWTSSANTVASVDATGKITALAPGAATITATSTVDNTVAGSLALTVRAPAPATISIKSVTTGATNVPVDFNNVQNQIDATLNVDPGDQVISKVEILLDGAVVYSQAFSAQQSQDMSLAAVTEAIAEIVGSINTADYDATTGVAKYLNGARQLSARAVVVGGTQVATPSISLQFNNANRFIEQLTLGGTRASAVSAGGLAYERGSLTISVLPVIYSAGRTMAAGTVSFGGSDASGIGTRTATLTAPAGGTGAWTATFSDAGTNGVGNVSDYEYNGAGPGENAWLSATDNGGNQLFAFTGPYSTPASPAPLVRLDNRAPGAPTFVANPNGRQNSWINATVGLAGLNSSATDNDWMANGTPDQGVGGYTRWLRSGTDMATAIAATASSTPALPAPSSTNATYCAVASATDLLGNESALPASTATCYQEPTGTSYVATGSNNLRFGVDVAAPTIAFSAGLASNARINTATVGGEFQVTVADTGAVGNSGMLAGTPVAATVTIRNAAGVSGCLAGTVVSGVCTPSATGLAIALPLVATNAVAASGTVGYYTYTSYAQDAAGNASGTVTRVVVRDNSPVVATAPAVPVTITGAFTASSFLNDDLSIRDYYYTVGFGGLLLPAPMTLAAAPTAVDAYNAATFTNTNVAINTSVNTFLGLQNGTGGAPAAYAANSYPLNALNLFARDQTQAAYTAASSSVAPTAPASGIAISGVSPAWTFTNYVGATSNGTICAGTLPAGCGATPTSTNLTATATGTTATFNNPFSRVDFYGVNAAGDYQLLGSVPAASATLIDNGSTRVWTYTFSLSGSAAGAALGTGVTRDIRAFGVNAAGNVALLSNGTSQIINP